MLPSFAASSMLVYEWFQDQQETRLLIYAILCLVVGVVGGMFIVHQSAAVTAEAEKTKEAAENSSWSKEVKEFQEAKILDAADIGWGSGFNESVPEVVLSALRGVSSGDNSKMEMSPSADPGRVENRNIDETGPSVKKPAPVGSVASSAVPATAVASASVHAVSAMGGMAKLAGAEMIALGASSTPISEPPSLDFSPAVSAADFEPPTQATLDSVTSIAPEFEFLAALETDEKSNPAKETVDRAQAVVARLEAEVAKAEVVAAKLESELAKAEPVAALLSGETESSGVVNFAFVFAEHEHNPSENGEVKTLPEFERAEDWLAYAAQLVHDQNFDDAIKCYDKVSVLDNKNFDAWYLKSVALRRKGRGEDAIYCVNYALSLRSDDSRALSEKGECLLQMSRHEQALNWFEKAISADDNNARAWCGKARCLAAAAKHKDAIKCYEKVLSLDPNNEEAMKAKGECAKRV